MKKFALSILFTFITFSFIVGQNLVATGISNQTQIRNIISNAGFTIQDEPLSNVNSSTLAGKQVLTLFNGGQTWNGTQIFTSPQADDIINFVQNGGYLYISSRKGYDNLLSQFGVTTYGNDGGSSGFDWPLIELSATQFSSHPITQSLNSVVGDVGASFIVDANWTIIGEDNSDMDLLAVRNYGSGKIVLWYGQRSFRDPGSTGNVYETDITEGNNTQFYVNLFTFFNNNVQEFITEFHDLNNNEVPDGWVLFVHNATVTIENGYLLATPIDARGCLMRSGVVPENTTKMTFEWDGNLSYAYWGMQNQLQLDFNQDKWLIISLITAEYNFGGMNKVQITYFDGNQEIKVFEESIQKEWSDFHCKVEVFGNNLTLKSTYLSNGNLYYEKTFDIVDLIPTYNFESINKVRFWAYTTTDNDNWLDNISIEVNNATGVWSNISLNTMGVFPNPASDYIKIDIDQRIKYKIYNLLGKKISESSSAINAGETIDISHLQPGIYFLKCYNEAGKDYGSEKFVKD